MLIGGSDRMFLFQVCKGGAAIVAGFVYGWHTWSLPQFSHCEGLQLCYFPASTMNSASLRIAKRISAVSAYRRLKSFKKAAKEVGSDVSFVKTWVKRKNLGLGFLDKPRPGRPRMLSPDDPELVDFILSCMSQELAPKEIAILIYEQFDVDVRDRKGETVRRFIKDHLGRPLAPRKKPRLTSKHELDRRVFSRYWLKKDWSNVVVTDSKYFWLCPRGIGKKVWVPYGHGAPDIPAEKNCYKVHAYAGVSKHGRTKLFVTVGTTGLKSESKGVNGSVYKQLLEEELIPACRGIVRNHANGWVFQQDNARAHTSRVVQQWLLEQDFNVMKWPAKSPDLSWIENLWAYVTHQLKRMKGLTPQNFEHKLQEAWANIPQPVHDKHFQSIRKRLQACLDANGGITKY